MAERTIKALFKKRSPLVMDAFTLFGSPDEWEHLESLHHKAERALVLRDNQGQPEIYIPDFVVMQSFLHTERTLLGKTWRDDCLVQTDLEILEVTMTGSKDWTINVMHSRSGATKAKPQFNDWGFMALMYIQTGALEELKRIIQKAGTVAGLMFRAPSHGGIFGQYRLAEWIET